MFRETLEALKGRRKPAPSVGGLRHVLLNTDTPQKADGPNPSWMQDLLAQYDSGSELQKLVDLIQSELDAVQPRASTVNFTLDERSQMYPRRCLHALRYLSTRHQLLPSSLLINKNIKPEGTRPVAGGGFADIWRGSIGSQRVCLKVLRLVLEPDEEVRENIRKRFCNEAVLWRQLKHPNILPLLGVNIKLFDPSFCLISPWMANGDIITFLKRNPMYDRHTAFLDIAAGLSYLHSRNPPITHGDIRGANILITDDLHCCLADFGLAIITVNTHTWSTATTTNIKGSLRWMAPELIHIDGPAEATFNHPSRDIYAFGCTIVEILTLRYPFHDIKTDYGVITSLMSGNRPDRPHQSVWCSDAVWDLTTHCWAQHSSARPEVHEVYKTLQHIFQGHTKPHGPDILTTVTQSNHERLVAEPAGPRANHPRFAPISNVGIHAPTIERVAVGANLSMDQDSLSKVVHRNQLIVQNQAFPLPYTSVIPITDSADCFPDVKVITLHVYHKAEEGHTEDTAFELKVVSHYYPSPDQNTIPNSREFTLFRTFDNIYNFQIALHHAFPQIGLPNPGKMLYHIPEPFDRQSSAYEEYATICRKHFNDFFDRLCNLKKADAKHVLEAQSTREFFALRYGDAETSTQPEIGGQINADNLFQNLPNPTLDLYHRPGPPAPTHQQNIDDQIKSVRSLFGLL